MHSLLNWGVAGPLVKMWDLQTQHWWKLETLWSFWLHLYFTL